MRTTFTYRLDEEKIRQQLKQSTLPMKEEAWQKFSAYAEAHARPVSVKKLPSLKLNLNGRMIMPAAAAAALVLVTVLLLNFVNLKGTAKNPAPAETAEPFVPMPQVSEAETIVPPAHNTPAENYGLAQNTEGVESARPSLVIEKKSDKKSQPDPGMQGPVVNDLHGATTHTEVKKKVRVEALDLEPVQLPDIRPSLLSPEQEEDIRTN